MVDQEAGVGVADQPSSGQQTSKPEERRALRAEPSVGGRPQDEQRKAKKETKADRESAAKAQKKALKQQKKALKKAMKARKKKAREKASVRYDNRMSRDEAVAYFEAILSGLKKGMIQVRQGADAVVVSPPDTLKVAMRVKARKKKEFVAIRFSWPVRERRK